MNYEESLANVNQKGKQSLILEGTPMLEHIMCSMMYNEQVAYEPTLSVIAVICGGCCEGDYIVIGKDLTNGKKIEKAIKVVVEDHDFKFGNSLQSRLEIGHIVRTLMHLGLTHERLITWG